MEIINCKICLTPNTRPRVKFDENKIVMLVNIKIKKKISIGPREQMN